METMTKEEKTLEIRYERGINGTYMILPGQPEETPGFARPMILNNNIPGCLPVSARHEEDGLCYEYKVSALISLAEYLEHHTLRRQVLKQWLFRLCQVVAELEEYLLTEDYLWLSPETVFLRGSETEPFLGNFYFCLYPDRRQNAREQLQDLLKYLMERTDPQDPGCGQMCYELYGLVQKENFCIQECMEVLENYARWQPPKEQERKGERKKGQKQLFARKRNSGIIKQ